MWINRRIVTEKRKKPEAVRNKEKRKDKRKRSEEWENGNIHVLHREERKKVTEVENERKWKEETR